MIGLGVFLKSLLTSRLFWIALLASALLGFAFAAHNAAVDSAVSQAMLNRDLADAEEIDRIKGDAKIKSDQHAADVAAIEQQSFQQGLKDEKIISDLRNDVAAGSRKLRQHTAACRSNIPNTDTTVSASDAASGAAEIGIAQDSERVVRAIEIGLTALKYWEESQGIIRADRAAINTKQGE